MTEPTRTATPAPQPVTTEAAPQDLLEDILREAQDRKDAPESLVAMTLRDAKSTVDLFATLHAESLKQTYPEDWVQFKAQDGSQVCFLQDVGCQRIRGLWQIDFEAVHLATDMMDEELESGGFVAQIIVRGCSGVTRETIEDIGFRSSDGFFGHAWNKAKEEKSDVKLARVKVDIRKGALANGRGRIVRTITGTSQVPLERLKVVFGDNVSRIRGAEFQAGTKGGSGNYASEPQCKMIASEAMKKVAGLKQSIGYPELVKILQGASLTGGRGGRASEIIEHLQAQEPVSITVDNFEKSVGVAILSEGGGE